MLTETDLDAALKNKLASNNESSDNLFQLVASLQSSTSAKSVDFSIDAMDGSIKANKIASDSMIVDKIKASSITVDELNGDTLVLNYNAAKSFNSMIETKESIGWVGNISCSIANFTVPQDGTIWADFSTSGRSDDIYAYRDSRLIQINGRTDFKWFSRDIKMTYKDTDHTGRDIYTATIHIMTYVKKAIKSIFYIFYIMKIKMPLVL